MTRICRLAVALAVCAAFAPLSLAQVTGLSAADPSRHVLITIRNVPQPGLRRAGSTWRGWAWSGHYDATISVNRTIRDLSDDYALTPVDEWAIALLDEHCIVLRLEDGADRSDVLRKLGADRRVALAQPLNVFETQATNYNDRLYDSQYAARVLGLSSAHSVATGRGVRIALIDTGVSDRHPDLDGQVSKKKDFTDVLPNGQERHGTAMAGVLVARANNQTGIVGVAPEANLAALRACWPLTTGSDKAQCNSFTLSRAIGAAADMRADILNLSLSGPRDPLLDRMIVTLIERGIVVVGAVAEPESDEAAFPASIPGVIAVRRATRTPGPTNANAMAAPGTDVITTVGEKGYDYVSGSSIATAQVSGVAALLRQLDPAMSPAAITRVLQASQRASALPEFQDSGESVSACEAIAIHSARSEICSATTLPGSPRSGSTPVRLRETVGRPGR